MRVASLLASHFCFSVVLMALVMVSILKDRDVASFHHTATIRSHFWRKTVPSTSWEKNRPASSQLRDSILLDPSHLLNVISLTVEPLPFITSPHPLVRDMLIGMVLALMSDVLAQITSKLGEISAPNTSPNPSTSSSSPATPTKPISKSSLRENRQTRIASLPTAMSFNNSDSSFSLFAPLSFPPSEANNHAVTSSSSSSSSSSSLITGIALSLAQFLSCIKLDYPRISRFAIFGFFDGAVGHSWFYTLESYITGYRFVDILARIAADAVIYTPIWCLWFLFAMNILERRFSAIFFGKMKAWMEEWTSLVKLSTSVYLPISFVLYSFIPIERRVFASAIGTMICTVFLSIWNATRSKSLV